MVLTEISGEVVDLDSHYGSRGLATKGFGTMPLVDILASLQRIYGKPSYQELDVALLFLNKPMNRIQPLKFILIVIKEVKLFLLANSYKDRALTEPNLVSYTLIKLTKTGGHVCQSHR